MATTCLVALAGNPNTGKSTIFNRLTGLKQHTGNWPGKTVLQLKGSFLYQGTAYDVVDLPGTYSLKASSPEEVVARDFLSSGLPHATVIVVDATSLERNLNLVMQILAITPNVILCLNLMDEARRHGLIIDVQRLEEWLGVPVVPTTATRGDGLDELKDAIHRMAQGRLQAEPRDLDTTDASRIFELAEEITSQVVSSSLQPKFALTPTLDRIVTSKRFGIPLMVGLLALILWITIVLANYPSALLSELFAQAEHYLTRIVPPWLHGAFVLGVYRSVAWVVAVMLPPMAIFFPLFSLLEDFGFLPRLAFNLDHLFQKAGAHGKQALTMSMGLGCNAVGVIAARIIDSPRERLLAIVTNSLIPCNGRFPMLLVMGAILARILVGSAYQGLFATGLVVGAITLSIFASLGLSKLLAVTLLRGEASYFILELPPYRLPQVGAVLLRSFLDRTLAVLARAVVVAAPAGLIIWLLANLSHGEISILAHLSGALDPFARQLGLDGMILLAFILGLPANEIVIPILLMGYLGKGALLELEGLAAIQDLLARQGWTWLTALNFTILTLFHWPCATTLLTIKNETKSLKWTIIAILAPTTLGLTLSFVLAKIVGLFL